MQQQVSDAGTYAHRYLADVVGVTGPVAAQYEQGLIIDHDLVWVELLTVLAIALIVSPQVPVPAQHLRSPRWRARELRVRVLAVRLVA